MYPEWSLLGVLTDVICGRGRMANLLVHLFLGFGIICVLVLSIEKIYKAWYRKCRLYDVCKVCISPCPYRKLENVDDPRRV